MVRFTNTPYRMSCLSFTLFPSFLAVHNACCLPVNLQPAAQKLFSKAFCEGNEPNNNVKGKKSTDPSKEIKKSAEEREKNMKKSDETKRENVAENKTTKMVRIKETSEDKVDEGQEVKAESPDGDKVHIFL